ncbi:MAG: hypothetical protein WDW38_010226 [Sanguina aurantia]
MHSQAQLSAQFLLAQQKVVEECGLLDTTVRVWLAPVNAVLPGIGLHIHWHGLFMEQAPGLSLNSMAYVTQREFVEGRLLGALQRRLNTTRVVHAAIADLLTSQCDRHSQNVYVEENGNFKLIDNLHALHFLWRWCAVDSIFLPGTLKNEIARFGGDAVNKVKGAKPRKNMNPMLLLDYRCYVPAGKLHTSYPPQTKRCLEKLSRSSPPAIKSEYGFPNERSALALQQRAAGMLEHGFEWALQHAAALLEAALLKLNTPVFDGDTAAAEAWVRHALGKKAVSMHSHHSGIVPLLDQILEKYRLPNCSVCHGCTTDLQPVKALFAFGQDWKLDQGASSEWLFFADTPQAATTAAAAAAGGGERAVLKVWCMPVDKVRRLFRWVCTNDVVATRSVRFLIAQQRVVEECGLLDATVRVWLAPVNAILPGVGLHIWWDGLWMAKADGISLNQLSYVTKKAWAVEATMELLNTQLNGTRVVRAAMMDLLTSQCDRHSQNVFMDERGKLTLIDNQQALKFNWVKCGVDSIFLPGTQENEIVRFGGDWVGKRRGGAPRRYANPMILLDYRCYVPNGLIGRAYPPALKQCLEKLSSMGAREIQDSYGFPMLRNAEVLLSRASDMHHKGFEWALQFGEPRNMPPLRYNIQPPCCKLRWDKGGGAVCAHEWNLTPALPFGDPIGGGPWNRKWPDVGTFTMA